MAGFFFNEDVATPEAIDRRRALINALAKDNLSTAPVGHWTAGLARVVGAGADQYENARLNEQEKKGADENKRALMAAFGIGGAVSPGAPTAAAGVPASAPAAAPTATNAGPVNPNEIGGRLAADLQRDFALKPEQAAGIVGNLAHESGNFRTLQEIKPVVPGSRGGYGYAQWTGPRRIAFEQYAHQNGLDPTSYEANYGFLKHELQNTGEGKVLNALRQAGDVNSATQIFSDQFLRPGVPAMDSRLRLASQYAGSGQSAAPALTSALGNGQPVNVPPGAPAGTPQITPNNAAPVQPDMSSPNAAPAQAQYNVPGVGLVPAQGVGQAPAASPGAGMTPQAAALIQALSSPWAARNPMLAQVGQTMLSQQLAGNKFQYQTLPDGTILALDPTGRRAPVPVYQAQTKPQYGVIGKDEFNNERYGWINPVTQQVTPGPSMNSQQPSQPGVPAAAQAVPPAPPGVDPKKWREIHSTRQAEEAAGPKSSEVAELRKEVLQLPSYKNLSQAAPIYQSMFKTAGTNSRASDLNLVYGLGKIMDPTSVVREGEMVMVKNTASLPDWLIGAANSLNGGQALTPETRAAILAEAHNRITSYQDQYNLDAEHYRGIAGRAKMRSEDVIPNFGEFRPWTPAPAAPKPNTQPPPAPGAPTREQVIEEMRKRGLTPPQ